MQNNAIIKCSNSLISGFYCLLDDVKKTENKFKDNIIVVPDKFTLNAERLVFEHLNIESSFNIQVMSLTRLVNKILSRKVSNYQLVSQNMGQMLVSKIMLDNRDKLVLYKNISPDVCAEFYNTIIQLKSSGISPSELTSKKQDLVLSMKLEDIKFVYEEYLKQNGSNKLDSADLLELFASEVKNSDFIKNANVFVAMFDSFSYRQMKCLVSLCYASANFNIYLSANTLQTNKKIYLNETLQQVLENFRKNKITYKIENVLYKINKNVDFFAKNLFGNVEQKLKTQDVLLCEAQDVSEEIDFVARKIKQMVVSGQYKFGDFNIACASFINYKLAFEKNFKQYSLPFYFDYSTSIDSHFFIKFVYNVLNLVNFNFAKDDIKAFLKSPFVNVSSQEYNLLDNYITKFGIDHEIFTKKFYDASIEQIRKKYLSTLIEFAGCFKKCTTVNEFVNSLINFLQKLDCENVLEIISQNDSFDVSFARATSQVYAKFIEITNMIAITLGEVECNLDYFCALLENALSQVSLSTVPLGVNKIFVGDASQSSFYPTKCLFVVGASDGNLPVYKNDCGMITDREIGMLSSNNLLSPSIQFVNKCSKYSLFELLLTTREKLFVSYPSLMFSVASRQSELFDALKNICCYENNSPLEIYKISSELDYMLLENSQSQANYVLGNLTHAKKLLKNATNTNFKLDNLEKILLQNKTNCDNPSQVDFKTLYFPSNKVSVSQIERYFACPYIHFLEYGLKLKEKEVFGLKSVDFGNFLHLVAEQFVNMLINSNFEYDRESTLKLIQSLANEQFIKSAYTVEKSKVNSLIKEALVMCERINSQISKSEFKPQQVEKKFVSNMEFNGLKIHGKIDRVDAWQNFIVIYDYKTGKSEFSFKDVFYGNKIQSILYLSILENVENVTGVGAFYIPIKSKFVDDDYEDKFNGTFLNQQDIINALDCEISQNQKSDIFKIKFKADGSLYSYSEKYALSPLEIENLKKYVLAVFEGAITEICDGNILPCPTSDACTYCKYKTICCFKSESLGHRKKELEIDKHTFATKKEILNGQN